jgi:hypothetical protein
MVSGFLSKGRLIIKLSFQAKRGMTDEPGTPNIAGNFLRRACVLSIDSGFPPPADANRAAQGAHTMDGELVGLVAVIMVFGIPLAAMYTFYHVRKLRTEERLAAIARGANVPMQPELSEAARSRRSGILLVAGSLGYIATFALIARVESDAWVATAFGIIPLCVGLGFFLDSALIRRDQHA